MTVETACHLSQDTRKEIQELLTLNIDSRDGFRSVSESIEDVTIGSLCQTLAMQRQAQADELARILECNADKVDRSGSIAAAVHRTWMDIREGLSSNNPYSLLAEAERGEDKIKGAYEDCLKKTAGNGATDVLNRQYAQVKAAHDRIRALRDEYKE